MQEVWREKHSIMKKGFLTLNHLQFCTVSQGLPARITNGE